MHTPWGTAQEVRQLTTGFVVVRVGNTSGYLLADSFAQQKLTSQARDYATRYGRYYCYDTPILGCIVELELERFWPTFLAGSPKTILDDPYPYLFRRASYYQAGYLIARRLTPDPDCHRLWKIRQEASHRARDGDHDLIVECEPWATGVKNLCVVTTADGKRHIIKFKSYQRIEGLKLLSHCTLTKGSCLAPIDDKNKPAAH